MQRPSPPQRRGMWLSWLRWSAVLACFCVAAPCSAADTWTTPFPGVRLLKRVTTTPWRIFALEVDLCARGVATRATKSTEKKLTTSAFRALVAAEAAINGDFFVSAARSREDAS